MKITIRLKLFLILSALIALFVVAAQVFSVFFLEWFYVYSKKNILRESVEHTQQYLSAEENPDDFINSLMNAKGVAISVADEEFNDIFSMIMSTRIESVVLGVADEDRGDFSVFPLSERKNNMMKALFDKYYVPSPEPVIISNIDLSEELSMYSAGVASAQALPRDTGEGQGQATWTGVNVYGTERVTAIASGMVLPIIDRVSYLCALSTGVMSDGSKCYIMVQTSMQAMRDSVSAANEFVRYLSLFIFCIGLIIILFVSKGISRHILKIADAAKKMSALDFSEHIDIKSRDEIGELADNINILSDTLHETISRLNTANIELTESIKLKEKIDEARKGFIADVSHELKTPISIIGGYAEGLKLNVSAEDKDFYCDVIIDESGRMNRLVQGLMDLMQVESGYALMEMEVFDLSEMLLQISEKYRLVFAEKGLAVEVGADAGLYTKADSERIGQVITNYINNAVKHTERGGTVKIRAQKENGSVKVSVFNSGKTIDKEQLEKIWGSFYKADKSRNRAEGGHGLGLSIVKAIMASHDGECGVFNEHGGVCFWFSIDEYVQG